MSGAKNPAELVA